MKRSLAIFLIISILIMAGMLIARMVSPQVVAIFIGGFVGQWISEILIPKLPFIPKGTYGTDWNSRRIIRIGLLLSIFLINLSLPFFVVLLLVGLSSGILGVVIDMRNLRFVEESQKYYSGNFNKLSKTPKV